MKSIGLKWFILEDEIHKDGGCNNPPRPILKKILARHELTIAINAAEAISKYDPQAGYTHLIIDYDMEGWPNPNLQHPNTGLKFVQHLVKFKLPVPQPEIFLHSQNVKGRNAMAKLLGASGYKKVSEHYYGQEYVSMLSGRFL